MVGILVVAHGTLADGLVGCATHVFGARPRKVEALNIGPQEDPAELLNRAQHLIEQLDEGDGVLVLNDVFGATPCNVACRVLQPGRVEGVSGVNVPMLLKAISYQNEPLPQLVTKVMTGGAEGVQLLPATPSQNA